MRFRSTVFCLAVILSCLTQGSDMVHAQSPALLEAYNRFNTYYQQGRYSDALPYATEALRLAEDEFGPDHLDTAIILNDLALLYQSQGNYAEVEPLYQSAFTGRSPAYPHAHRLNSNKRMS